MMKILWESGQFPPNLEALLERDWRGQTMVVLVSDCLETAILYCGDEPLPSNREPDEIMCCADSPDRLAQRVRGAVREWESWE